MKKVIFVLLFSFAALSVYAQKENGAFEALQKIIDSASEQYDTTLQKHGKNASSVEAYYKYEEFERRFTVLNKHMHDLDYRLKLEIARRDTVEITKTHKELQRANQLLVDLKAEYDEWMDTLQ